MLFAYQGQTLKAGGRERAFQLDCEPVPCHVIKYVVILIIRYCFYVFIARMCECACRGGWKKDAKG